MNQTLALPGLIFGERLDLNHVVGYPLTSESQVARQSVRMNLHNVKQDLVDNFHSLLTTYPPKLPDGSVTDKSLRVEIANSLADDYIRGVDQFLEKFPGARPRNGVRGKFESVADSPYCADWANAMGYVMSQNTYAQKGLVHVSGPMLTIGHNVTAIVPNGYNVNWSNVDRKAAPFVIADPWPTIQPRVYQYSAPGSPYTTSGGGAAYDRDWEDWNK